ncbi:MAG: DUF2202 domain-containing protein [Lamprocystis purpurea]|jgi:hypothetical protein|uniref:DUF2202 domain-containing protein n=1 Tax=Lamprocystis purpurea TaxID=61598 RepID=UPI000370F016|nr:DUF2202 domain-containing protein [Lamprocystis purpurea]MBV5275669.1 DUF2202 domain-containing protein [Lamprocystis purpurea]
MNLNYRLLPLALTAVLAAAPALGAGPRGTRPVLPTVDAGEAASLTFMREEEKVARDTYLAMEARWDALPFANIAQSEQQHMDAVKASLTKYALPDPVNPDLPGVFDNETLQQMYTDLLARGETSYLEALRVGGLIEEVDIDDVQDAMDATDNADLKTMYGNLLRGSRNHLRAFAAAIEALGVVYEAQHLEQATVDAIIDSPMERGGMAGAPATDRVLAALDDRETMARGGAGQGSGQGSKGKGKGTCS